LLLHLPRDPERVSTIIFS